MTATHGLQTAGRPPVATPPNHRTTPHHMSTIRHMPADRDHTATTRIPVDLYNWLNTTAHQEHRKRSQLIWVLLEEARQARGANTAATHNGTTHITGQTAIPIPGQPDTS